MIRGLYSAATGMNAQQHNLDVISNNISNVNTAGYKKGRAEFHDLMYESLNFTAGATSDSTRNPTGIDVGLGVRISGVQRSFLQGDLKETGNTYDIAIEGDGFFTITLPNGESAYTKNGAFKLNADGALVNGSGYELDPAITIPVNVTDVVISETGLVTAKNPTTGATVQLGQITITDFTNPAGLTPLGGTLYQESEASGAGNTANPGTNQFGSLRQGMIELSNVQLVNEMVDLITAQRGYEANSKAITTTDSMLQIVNRLKT